MENQQATENTERLTQTEISGKSNSPDFDQSAYASMQESKMRDSTAERYLGQLSITDASRVNDCVPLQDPNTVATEIHRNRNYFERMRGSLELSQRVAPQQTVEYIEQINRILHDRRVPLMIENRAGQLGLQYTMLNPSIPPRR